MEFGILLCLFEHGYEICGLMDSFSALTELPLLDR